MNNDARAALGGGSGGSSSSGSGSSGREEGKQPLTQLQLQEGGGIKRRRPSLTISLTREDGGSWLEEALAWASALIAEHRQLSFALAGVLLMTGVGIGLFGGMAASSPSTPAVITSQGLLPSSSTGGGGGLPWVKGGGDLVRLRSLISSQAAKALAGGALHPIATTFEIVKDHHINFIVSKVNEARAAEKDEATSSSSSSEGGVLLRGGDPFGEGNRDPMLVVTDVGPDHVLMLNKFNTMTDHVLIVTRKFVPQSEGLLSRADLVALDAVVTHTPAVGFFNSGEEAGASQPHRHMQAVPLDVLQRYNSDDPTQPAIPLDSLIDAYLTKQQQQGGGLPTSSFSLPSLPFKHRILLLPPDHEPATLEGAYHRLLKRIVGCSVADGPSSSSSSASRSCVGGGEEGGGSGVDVSAAYNMVLSSRWMLVAPRTQGKYLGVGVNGLGYVGALLARGEQVVQAIKNVGPVVILRGVGLPRQT